MEHTENEHIVSAQDIAGVANTPDMQQTVEHERLLYEDVCDIINNARREIATYANTRICLTKWYVGKRIKEDVLFNQRAEYGKQMVKHLSKKLTQRYGAGWSDRTLLHCIRAAYTFSRDEIVFVNEFHKAFNHVYQYARHNMGLQSPVYGHHVEDITEYVDGENIKRTGVRVNN